MERSYNDLCLKIFEEKNEINFEEIKESMRNYIVSSEEFKLSFKNKVIKTKNNKKLLTEILKRIEKNRHSSIGDNYTIEHILPENYTDSWNLIFNNKAGEYVYRLGNYILLEKDFNSEIGNKSFELKKTKYENSIYKGAKNIALLDNWNKEELEKHQNEMARIAETIWSI